MSLEDRKSDGDEGAVVQDVSLMDIFAARELFHESFRTKDVSAMSEALVQISDKNSEVARLLASGVAQFGGVEEVLEVLRRVDVASGAGEILAEGVAMVGELGAMVFALGMVRANPRAVFMLAKMITILKLPEVSAHVLLNVDCDSEAGRILAERATECTDVRVLISVLECIDANSLAGRILANRVSSGTLKQILDAIQNVPVGSCAEVILINSLIARDFEFALEALDVLKERSTFAYRAAYETAKLGNVDRMIDVLSKLKGGCPEAREYLIWQIVGFKHYGKIIELLGSGVVDCSSREGEILASAIAGSRDPEWMEIALAALGRADSAAKEVLIREGVLHGSNRRMLVVAFALVNHNSEIARKLAEDIVSRSDIEMIREALEVAVRGSVVEKVLISGIAERNLHADDFVDLLDRADSGSDLEKNLIRKLVRDECCERGSAFDIAMISELRSVDSRRAEVIVEMIGTVDPSSDAACALARGLIRYHVSDEQIRYALFKLQDNSPAAGILEEYLEKRDKKEAA